MLCMLLWRIGAAITVQQYPASCAGMPPVVVVDTVTHGFTNGLEYANQLVYTYMDAFT